MIKEKKGEWKIQLTMKINFISSKNFNETRDMYSKSDNFEIMMGVDILRRYQKGLQKLMRGSDFVFDYVDSLNYVFHK